MALTGAPEVRYQPELYADGVDDALELVTTAPEPVATVLLIGHNPTVSMLSALLDGDRTRELDGLRTSGLAVHGREGGWSTWTVGGAPLLVSGTPRA
jgi:phosphohistidine phosphatase